MLGKKNLIPSSESHQHLAFLSRTWTLNKLKTSKGGRETIVARGSRKRLVPRTRFSQLAGSGLPNSVQSTPTSKPRLACHKQGVTRLYAFAGYYRWQPQLRRGHYPADTTTATATRCCQPFVWPACQMNSTCCPFTSQSEPVQLRLASTSGDACHHLNLWFSEATTLTHNTWFQSFFLIFYVLQHTG